MIIISHRRNTIQDLKSTDTKYGIEVDIRSNNSDLIIHHDPFEEGQNFNLWIEQYNHKFLILNVKEEGLEKRLIDIMRHKNIKDYFFLDQSFPFIVKWSNLGEKNCAVRVSEFESINTALALSKKVKWIWVDCFTRFPLTKKDVYSLKESGFKLCLVSPELQGRKAEEEIPIYKDLINSLQIKIDAVCTKRIELWEE